MTSNGNKYQNSTGFCFIENQDYFFFKTNKLTNLNKRANQMVILIEAVKWSHSNHSDKKHIFMGTFYIQNITNWKKCFQRHRESTDNLAFSSVVYVSPSHFSRTKRKRSVITWGKRKRKISDGTSIHRFPIKPTLLHRHPRLPQCYAHNVYENFGKWWTTLS